MAKQDKENMFQKVVSHAKEYGFVFPSSEIYGGLQAVYDYGSNGVELRNNIKKYWWASMVQMHENIVGIDASIFMDPKVWKASGHVDAFNDPLVDNKDSKKRYRADVLIEDLMAKYGAKIEKEVTKAQKKFGDAFDKEQFLATNPNVLRNQKKIDEIEAKFKTALEDEDMEGLKAIIEENNIVCPISGTCNWTDVRQFNLMFATELGAVAGDSNKIYLRPETAQGIFVNFLNVMNTSRQRPPFGIAQIGKAFRNEIVARQFIFRMREFEQMEMQFFIQPGTEMKWYEYWKEQRMKFHTVVGNPDNYVFHDHLKTAHYANAAVDIEFKFPFGQKELEGIHSRTDFDLNAHQELSSKKLQYFDHELGKNVVPYVVETSVGLDRMFLSILTGAYTEEEVEGKARTFLKLHPALAPIKAAVFPLTKKDGLPEKAREAMNEIKFDHNVSYEEKDAIGKRYTRQDLIGTPYCITVDHQTLEDNTVTVRERDTMDQFRLPISELKQFLDEKCSLTSLLKQLL
ncbi:glycine--tRNA ligase [Flammeovirga aprica]|uniref:Glycine--tRNA ligase n=1 Tax=Flammeovirga aprica JL-4 TaxID=694437 RepID=A0A7X9RVY5_9BACT|nr:glycine--tRNA ligase [Flammeovirga aprica]NME69726.1 glycine--tRNA ligase [Flammeovirga aprica JL-4]